MTNKNCYSFHDLNQYSSDNMAIQARTSIEKHINGCPVCQENYELIQATKQKLAKRHRSIEREKLPMPEEFQDLLTKYFSHNLDKDEKARFFKYLFLYPTCFKDFTSIRKNSSKPITQEERAFVKELEHITVTDRLSRYEKEFIKGNSPKPTKKPERQPLRIRLPNWLQLRFLAPAFAIVFAFIALTKIQEDNLINAANSDYEKAAKKFRVAENDIRPVGVDIFSPVDELRSSKDKTALMQEYSDLFKALKEKPHNPELCNKVATLFYYNEMKVEARKYFLTALAQEPDNPDIYNNIALIDVDEGNYEMALQHLQKALTLAPVLAEAHYNIAIVHKLAKNVADEIEAWQSYLQLTSDQDSEFYLIAQKRLQQLLEE